MAHNDYDALGRVIQSSNPLGAIRTFDYGPFGGLRARSQFDESGKVAIEAEEYGFDDRGRLQSVVSKANVLASIKYDLLGRKAREVRATAQGTTGDWITTYVGASAKVDRMETPGRKYVFSYDPQLGFPSNVSAEAVSDNGLDGSAFGSVRFDSTTWQDYPKACPSLAWAEGSLFPGCRRI